MPSLPDDCSVEDSNAASQSASRQFSELTPGQPLELVLVLRRCAQCGAQKPLEHFLVSTWRGHVVGDAKVCASCRLRKFVRHRQTPRRLGRYLDLPLDDWAGAS